MAAQFIIRDANGVVVLDLSYRITRLTIDYSRTTNPSSVPQPELIKVGSKADRASIWFLTRFSKTARYNNQNIEGGCFPSFAVYLIDKAELLASDFSSGFKDPIASRMDDVSLYLMVVDTRESAATGYQNSVTIDVGRY